MKKYLVILLLSVINTMMYAEDNWQPIKSIPFIYQEFMSAKVYTADGKTLNVFANIHVAHSSLWYKSNFGQNKEAGTGMAKEVVFADGSRYLDEDGRLCLVIREDTIKGEIHRLLCSKEINMQAYSENVLRKRMAEGSSLLDIQGLNDMNIDVSVRESTVLEDEEALPLTERYYIHLGKESFEATESKILRHLADKEERNAYRSYTRNAEIITGSRQSMLDVYTTFFMK